MYKDILKSIQTSSNIVLCSHINPDGDALGSMIAFYLALLKMGKKSIMFNSTQELPIKYDFLPYISKIRNKFPKKCDLLICFDSGNMQRVGILRGEYKIINIDHHISNTNFGDINLVDQSSVSCTMVVYNFLQDISIKIDKQIATCIYVGLLEDTGFFTHSNVNSTVLKVASKLLDLGADASQLTQRDSLAKLRLTARFIDSFELKNCAQIAIGFVSQDMLKRCGASRSDSEHLADLLKNLATVKLVILIYEQNYKVFKISLRSKGDLDVSIIASKFGGGGHKNSSGFVCENLDKNKIVDKILSEVNI